MMSAINWRTTINKERQVIMEGKAIGYLALEQDAHLVDSIAAGVAAGRDLISTNSICPIGVAGRDLHLQNGFGGVLVTGNRVFVENSKVGILFGKGSAHLQGSKVLFTGSEVAAMGMIAGLVCLVVLSGIKLFRHLFR
jgi:hypothetical protein